MLVRSLQSGEQDACLDLWDTAFEKTPRAYFERYFQEPSWHRDDTVVWEENGILVSAVHVVRRVVETHQGRRNMAGIANVATHPDFRGGGRSTACLTEMIQRMEADPTLDFATLGTGIPGFYARLGWAPWKFRLWEGDNPFLGKAKPKSESCPATLADLDQIAAWHEKHNRNQPLAVVRSRRYWDDWIQWNPEGKLVSPDGYAQIADVQGVRIVQARTSGFPWHEAFGDAERVRLCVPLTDDEAHALLLNPTSTLWGGMMIRPLHNKPLPELAGSLYYDGDGF